MRAILNNRPGERMKSIEDACRRKEREKLQVCAGAFRSGVHWVLILTFILGLWTTHVTKSFSIFIASYIINISVGPQDSAISSARMTGKIIDPLVRIVVVVEFGSVQKDEGVADLVGILFWVPDGDPEKDSTFIVSYAKLVDCELSHLGIFTVK